LVVRKQSTNIIFKAWVPQVTVSGHFAPVVDISWNPTFEYLVSVSEDQTSRCFAEWKRTNEDNRENTWHEISRPLLHGHDLSCMSFVNGVRHRMVAGAEEKVKKLELNND
jgi:elongator complex protein 2